VLKRHVYRSKHTNSTLHAAFCQHALIPEQQQQLQSLQVVLGSPVSYLASQLMPNDVFLLFFTLFFTLFFSFFCSFAGDMAQGQQAEHAQVQLALIRAIPCMAMHQTALPFVQRALMPFSQKGAPTLTT